MKKFMKKSNLTSGNRKKVLPKGFLALVLCDEALELTRPGARL